MLTLLILATLVLLSSTPPPPPPASTNPETKPFLAGPGYLMTLGASLSSATYNGYVAEDGATYYVAEDGATYYVQE